MIKIQLTQGQFARVDDERGFLAVFKWHAQREPSTGSFYAKRHVRRPDGTRTIEALHRVVMELKLGRPLARGELVDHRDRDTLNCTDENLRLASSAQNQMNRKVRAANNTTGFKGVFYEPRSQRYVAQIGIGGRQRYLGAFVDPRDAAAAYDRVASRAFGDFALPNNSEMKGHP